MLGIMQDRPLLISSLIEHANRCHPGARDRLAHGRRADPPLHLRRHPPALEAGGQGAAGARRRAGRAHRARWPGTATATWSCTSASRAWARCCTRSIRGCSPSRSSTSPTTPRTRYLFFDLTFAPLVEKLGPLMKTVRGFVAMTDRAHMPSLDRAEPAVLRGAGRRAGRRLRVAELRRADGVVAVLHVGHHRPPQGRALFAPLDGAALAGGVCTIDGLGLSSAESALLVVPMFHVNAWGMPYAGAMCGAKLVLPGTGARRQERLRADAGREGDARARRADRLADAVRTTSTRRSSIRSATWCSGAPSSAARRRRAR